MNGLLNRWSWPTVNMPSGMLKRLTWSTVNMPKGMLTMDKEA